MFFMKNRWFRFGSLCVKYTGQTDLLSGTVLEKFCCNEETPDFTVELRSGELPPIMEGKLLVQTADFSVYFRDGLWQRRFIARYQGRTWEYAVAEYTEREAVLTVAPDCSNVPCCVESCSAFEHLSLCAGALPIHASHIQIGGRAIVFTAPCGTGKSTQAALWEKHRGAKVINGDKTLLLCKDRPILAAGLPYSGTSGICHNAAAPVEAIVVLEQAGENRITRLTGGRAALRLMTGAIVQSWHEGDVEKALDLVAQVVENVPVYLLACLPEESAVACLEAALEEKL